MKKHVRTLLALGVSLAFVVFTCFAILTVIDFACASNDSDDQCDYIPPPSTFIWEGELDPNEFDKWKVISAQSTPQGTVWIFIKNPDQDSSIKIVAAEITHTFTLIAYRYFKYGEPSQYIFKPGIGEKGAFVEYKFTEEQKKGCMECHQDEIIPRERI